MRYRIKEYSVSVSNNVVTLSFEVPDGMVISIDPEDGSLDPSDKRYIEESVRLIIDETNKVVLCSSMQKDRIINIAAQGIQGESTADTMIIYIAIPTGKTIASTDQFTIEFDWGDSLADLRGSNGEVTLTAIYEYLAGQTPEDIPEGLGDRINLLLQFFNLPQSLPSGYHEMSEAEVLEIADEVWDAMYGFVAVPNTVHTVDGGGSERVFTTYMNPNKTYADYGWPALWDAQGETIALTDHPTAGRVIYTFNPIND